MSDMYGLDCHTGDRRFFSRSLPLPLPYWFFWDASVKGWSGPKKIEAKLCNSSASLVWRGEEEQVGFP